MNLLSSMMVGKYSETWWPSGFDLAIIRETLKSQDDKIQDQEEQLGILSPVIQQMRLMQKPILQTFTHSAVGSAKPGTVSPGVRIRLCDIAPIPV